MAKLLDSPYSLADKTDQLKADGIRAVGRYYCVAGFKTCLDREEAAAYAKAGIYLVSIWENGRPTIAEYFTPERGHADGANARRLASAAGQPAGTGIYFTVDYDAQPEDLPAIGAYFRAVREELAGVYLAFVYGNGLVCRYLMEQGLVSKTWLAAGKRMAGYDDWLPHADIVQTAIDQQYHEIDVDDDETNGAGGGWLLA